MPMYCFAVLALFGIIAVDSRFSLNVPAPALMRQAVAWFGFSVFGLPNINGIAHTNTILGTIWTLKYEWVFYVSLPVVAFIYTVIRRASPIYVAVFLLSLPGAAASWFGFFATGGVSVHLLRDERRMTVTLWSLAGIVGPIILCLWYHDVQGPIQALLLLPVFMAAMQARGPWAVLLWRPTRFLGHISYSVYLLQLPLIHVFTGRLIGSEVYGSLKPGPFYGTVFLMGLGVIAISTVTYIAVEKPFLKMSSQSATSN